MPTHPARHLIPLALLLGAACSKPKPGTSSAQPERAVSREAAQAAAAARVPDLERRTARLELQLLEKDAAIEDLEQRLDDAQAEIVRAMARLPTVASRAEAASGMAEAEVMLQSLRASGTQSADGATQVQALLRQGSAEFDKQNYGGALYLAKQAKSLADSWRARVSAAGRIGLRPGETPFAVALRLRAMSRGNVRSGPGTHFAIAYSVEQGTVLAGHSYTDEWIRVTDVSGRSGWIFRGLVARP